MPLLPPGPPGPAPIRWLTALVDSAVILIGTAMVVLVFVNVILHVFHHDIAWTIEFCEFMMVWVILPGRRRGSPARRPHDDHRVHRHAPRHSTAHGRRRRPGPCAGHPGAAGLVRHRYRHGKLGQRSHGPRLAHGLSVHGPAYRVRGVLVFVSYDLVQILRGKTPEERYGA